MTGDPATIETYNRRATDYDQLAASSIEDQLLDEFANSLAQGARVLDLGCGPGKAAAHMVQAGLDVDATDASQEMVRLALSSGAKVRLATFDDLTASEQYDGVWANFSLLHAPRRDFPRHLDAIHSALRAGGLFFIGMKLGKGEKRDELGRFYSYYSEHELEQSLKTAGFHPIRRHKWKAPGLAGGVEPLIAITSHA